LLGWLKPSSADTPIEELRRRLFEDEYVFVKGLIPRDSVLQIREHYFSQFRSSGLLKPGSRSVDGIYNSSDDASLHNGVGGGGPTGNDELQCLVAVHVQQPYLDFVAHPNLRGMVRDLMGWSEEIMRAVELPMSLLPDVGPSAGVLGRVSADAASRTGLSAGVPVVGGGADNACGAAGVGVIAPGEVVTASRRPEDFVGRRREIRLLRGGGGPARIVVGGPGIGRTALLRHLGHWSATRPTAPRTA